jgi:homoserine kinase
MTSVTAFAPATVSNVCCGFDVLGFAMHEPGDEVTAHWIDGPESVGPGGVVVEEVAGDAGRVPREASRNTAGVAAAAVLRTAGVNRAVGIRIRKGLPLSSGLGGSAASAVAAAVAVDALSRAGLSRESLLACAFEGERDAAGSAHADNIAPALFGGFVLVRSVAPPDIVSLPVPPGLTAVVVHPELEIETARARALLGTTVPLADAIRQWANLGALVDALHRADFGLLSRSLEDTIAEPRRAPLVPGLTAIKRAATEAGALGAGLSGSGPSLFALCPDRAVAEQVAAAMALEVRTQIGGASQTFISAIAATGARVV